MERDGAYNILPNEEMASGDARHHSVLISQSLMGMLPDIDIDEDSVSEEEPMLPPELRMTLQMAHQADTRASDSLELEPANSRMSLSEEQSYSLRDQGGISPPTTLPLSSLLPLLTCHACYSVPISSMTVHVCAKGHQFCGDCFYGGHDVCKECDAPVDGRHEVLETVILRLRHVYPNLFRPRSTRFCRGLDLSSHRPIKCPHLSCNRVVASNGFFAHFEFEHPSVPMYPTSLGLRHSFFLPDRCLYDHRPQVIALLHLTLAPTHAILQSISTEKMERGVPCLLLACAVTMGPLRLVAAWCASLSPQQPPLFYTLQASATHSTRAATTSYTGSMRCLQDFEGPPMMLQEGQYLALAPGSLAFRSANLLLTFHLPPC